MYRDQAEQLRKNMQVNDKYSHGERATVISVISGKGGVGKSNVTLNFALTLGQQNKSVLIIDLDIGMGNIDILLGHQSRHSIVELFEQRLSIQDIIEHTPNNISYISGGSGLSTLFQMSEQKLSYFLDQFGWLLSSYDYIFLDMGAGVTSDSLSFILSADHCFVVTTPEPTAMMDAYAMMKHVHQQNKELPFYLLINRAESIREGRKALARLQAVSERFLGKSIEYLGILLYDKVVSRAVIKQVPFTRFAPNASVSKQLKQIVSVYLSESQPANQKVEHTFIAKFKSFFTER
ncbi:flagellar biosynthesis protein FlhG [Amphibacillus marinus]|uniref:Flagellar biosynthesis protein FlhG n=1 Tax=Amphibacillus marinus TaxID=872970 RepID=A0A1H8HQ21_9BACI|nr:MinD/ParA family protein [Amphibacillus marinus]SEN58124.1 flagellar biosynthesis protein FlhG [Amphibacillus marinus]